jgi:peroxiredoxin
MHRSLASLLFLACSLTWAGPAMAKGETPADFKLKQLAGPPIALSDHLGKDVIVISFWATWCTPCKAEMPHLQALHETYGKQGLTIFGINTDEGRDLAKVRSEVKTRGLGYAILLDSETEVLSQLNPAMNLPYTVVIDRKGKVHSIHEGFNPGDEKKLEAEVRSLLGLAEGSANPCAGAENPCKK